VKLRSLVLALILALSGCSAGKVDFHPPQGIQPLLTAGGTQDCTAFSVNEREHVWLTAAHCLDEADPEFIQLYLFHARVKQLAFDRTLDLCIFKGTFGAPALRFSPMPPESGDRIHVEGFFDESRFPTVFEGMYYSEGIVRNIRTKQFLLRAVFLLHVNPGQSGSPIMNDREEVISVAQLGFEKGDMAAGVTFPELKAFVEPYL
jgi:hypothetical protein